MNKMGKSVWIGIIIIMLLASIFIWALFLGIMIGNRQAQKNVRVAAPSSSLFPLKETDSQKKDPIVDQKTDEALIEKPAASAAPNNDEITEMVENEEAVQPKQPEENSQESAEDEKMLVHHAGKNTILLSGEAIVQGAKKSMEVDMDGRGNLAYFEIRRDTPNGLMLLGCQGNRGQNFANEISSSAVFDESVDEAKHYFVQISCRDLDRDYRREVIVSIGDKLDCCETLIFAADGGDEWQPFTLIGSIEGIQEMTITDDNAIEVPYGSQGLFSEYRLIKGELINTY